MAWLRYPRPWLEANHATLHFRCVGGGDWAVIVDILDPVWLDQYQIWILTSGSWNHGVVNKQNVKSESGFVKTNARSGSSYYTDVGIYQFYPCEFYQSCHWFVSFMMTVWRHQMETFSALLAICAGNSPVPGEFPTQRLVTRSFDVYFDLLRVKRLSKQSWGWWFETLSHSFWRHRNIIFYFQIVDCDLLKKIVWSFHQILAHRRPPSWIQWIQLRCWFHGFTNPDLVLENLP